ncbi:MFS transporter [Adlercreutzia sp. R25]|uniref:MFS transporter n=1 Tax=Adlercreutzia shanghongiae TaxID=3111773 RepID=A0ABU6IYX0_9ACTN|nr:MULTISPECIES: MFS transporter [unclassified Adlercreutzia]MEC4271868.1 MFS transporter [Adlercreutzia sp. R25]MEC4294871.1 MFS transporter [Adlercreutzia sp. R22]
MSDTIQIPPHISAKRRWASLAVLLFAQLVVSMDMTILNIALPHMVAEIQPTSDQQLWIIDAYSLVLAGLLVPSSSLSDRLGRKKTFLLGAAIFGVASALIMFASSAGAVIAIRAVLGIGGAFIMPTTISMIRSVFTDSKERATALAAWSALGSLGMVLGPLIGGFLLEHFSWHAAFLVNVPLMGLVVFVGLLILPEIKVRRAGAWDAPAALLALLAMVLMMWGIKHLAAELSFFNSEGLAALVAGIGLMVLFVVRCLHSETPLLDLRLFSLRPFRGGVITALCSMFGMAAQLFLLSQWLQLVNGSGPLESGMLLIPQAVASIVAGMAAPALAMRLGAKPVLLGGLGIGAVGMLMLLPFIDDLTLAPIIVSTVLAGLCTGSLSVGSAVIMCATPREKASSAAACEEVAYDMGNVLGVAVIGSVASIVYVLGLDPAALAASGLDAASISAAGESFPAAVAIAQQAGATELLAEAVRAFDHSVVVASAIGGIAIALACVAIARLIPNGLSITEEIEG